jgi:hypothetical protein
MGVLAVQGEFGPRGDAGAGSRRNAIRLDIIPGLPS